MKIWKIQCLQWRVHDQNTDRELHGVCPSGAKYKRIVTKLILWGAAFSTLCEIRNWRMVRLAKHSSCQ